MQSRISVKKQWPVISRVNQLEALLERYTCGLSLPELRNLLALEFPSPPIAAMPGVIEPITSPQMLLEESAKQHNCLAGGHYAQQVMRRQSYLYRVLPRFGLERATVELSKFPDGENRHRWIPTQIAGPHNEKVHRRTEEAIALWAARGQALDDDACRMKDVFRSVSCQGSLFEDEMDMPF